MISNKRSKRKGVSPVIAVVLLIALAVSIGVLVTTFVTQFINTQTSGGDMTCAINTNYIVESAEFNKTGMNNTLLIKVTNKNKQPIYGFGVAMNNGTYILQLDYTDSAVDQGGISSSNQLKREQSVFVKVDFKALNMTYTFGTSLQTSDEVEVRILNEACAAVSADIGVVS